MVKKLLKYEFIYYARSIGLFLPIVPVIGLMTRVFRFFDNGNILTGIALGSSALFLVVACIALIMMSTVIGIIRFYKNLYSAEGYLTFTLPVTNAQHIFVKLFVSLVCQTVCLLTVVLSAVIALSGKPLSDLILTLKFAGVAFPLPHGKVHMALFCLEFALYMLVSAVSGMLLYYACITIGQTAKKNRILMAVVTYFIYYAISQVIGTVFSMVVMVFSLSGSLGDIMVWIERNPVPILHVFLFLAILTSAAFGAVCWVVTQRIMSRRLNLE